MVMLSSKFKCFKLQKTGQFHCNGFAFFRSRYFVFSQQHQALIENIFPCIPRRFFHQETECLLSGMFFLGCFTVSNSPEQLT